MERWTIEYKEYVFALAFESPALFALASRIFQNQGLQVWQILFGVVVFVNGGRPMDNPKRNVRLITRVTPEERHITLATAMTALAVFLAKFYP